MSLDTPYNIASVLLKAIIDAYELTNNLNVYPSDYLCVNLPNWAWHENHCSPIDRRRAFHQSLLKNLPVWPDYFYVTSVLSPLNANPLWQNVIIYGLPDSWIPETVLEGFRAEADVGTGEDARRRNFWRRAEVRRGIMREPLFAERQPFDSTRARYVVRMINGRRALFDRQYSWTQPVYSPIVYYRY